MRTTEHPSKRCEGFEVNLLTTQGTSETFMMNGRAAQGHIVDISAQDQRQMRKEVNGRQVRKLLTAYTFEPLRIESKCKDQEAEDKGCPYKAL